VRTRLLTVLAAFSLLIVAAPAAGALSGGPVEHHCKGCPTQHIEHHCKGCPTESPDPKG